MRIDVFTIFPEAVDAYCMTSVVGRARREGLVDVRVHDLRVAASDPHRGVDDAPFGGGPGMVFAPEPVFGAVELIDPPRPLYLLAPGGRRFDQTVAAELAGPRGPAGSVPAFSLLCGRYEGVDQRISDHLADGELSVGDYVLAGGELAALVVVEATVRLVPGVLGNDASAGDESFTTGLLEYPQYTRPAVFRGWEVPEVLRGGDHGRVERWRRAAALWRTLELRPDLLEVRGGLSQAEVRLLVEHGYPLGAHGTGRAERPDSESGNRQRAGDPSDRLEERDL
ncbi:MAG: tRNA (guanosine(37)-N1)-methyltransferase TrmD [Acidimicrobiales bacterium]